MSLGIVFKGPEGVVLAADSRVTLTAQINQPPNPPMILPATFDNATKLLSVSGQKYVGVVSYGLGAIGTTDPRTAHSFMPEFEAELTKENVKRLSVLDFTTRLSGFFVRQWQAASMPTPFTGPDMVFVVAGFDDGSPYGCLHEFSIPSRPTPTEWHKDGFGIVWGGQQEFTERLINGFDPGLPELVKGALNLSDTDATALANHLRQQLQARIPYQFLPLQDCVDLAIFLIRATITLQRWTVGIRGVGGHIDVATITRTGGFSPVQQKHIVGEGEV